MIARKASGAVTATDDDARIDQLGSTVEYIANEKPAIFQEVCDAAKTGVTSAADPIEASIIADAIVPAEAGAEFYGEHPDGGRAEPDRDRKPARPANYWRARREFWRRESRRCGTDRLGIVLTLREVTTRLGGGR